MWQLSFMYSYYSSELQYRPTRTHSLTKCHPNLSYPWTQGTTGSQLFHRPLIDECKQLAAGIHAFDSHQDEGFVLHPYLISAHANIHAINHLLSLKAHHGICPSSISKTQPT